MLQYYCPNCWRELDGGEEHCPACGYDLRAFENLPYPEKLIRALYHPIPERRVMAAQILGELRYVQALPVFEHLVETLQGEAYDFYLLQAVLLAAARMPDPRRWRVLQKAAHHPAALVASLARRLLAESNHRESEAP